MKFYRTISPIQLVKDEENRLNLLSTTKREESMTFFVKKNDMKSHVQPQTKIKEQDPRKSHKRDKKKIMVLLLLEEEAH